MNAGADAVDHAINQLPVRNTFRDGDTSIAVAFLLRAPDWRPLKASWWRGKEACIVGADYNGNFFLRHCDGTVRYWDHAADSDKVLALSVEDFVAQLQCENVQPGDATDRKQG
jgi:hypothetical protein